MSDVRPESNWYEKADQDLAIARRALEPGKPLPGIACYHAQQCAEKYLKGYLTANSVSFRYVHDLVYLTQLCAVRESAFEELMSAAEILSEYAVRVRYPMDASDEPDIEAAKEAIRLAERVSVLVSRSGGRQPWRDHDREADGEEG